jgi:hypothetical protein
VPWSTWMIAPSTAPRESMAIPRALVARSACWRASIAQPTTRRGNRVQDHAAVQLALTGGTLRDVGTHKRFGASRVKSRLTKSMTVTTAGNPLCLAPQRKPRQARALHQQRHRVVPHRDAAAEHQLGVHPRLAVGTTGRVVKLTNQVGQPRMADRAFGRRPMHQS